jgi:hypothetical protein
MTRLRTAIVGCCLAGALVPASADAALKIYDSEATTLLATIERADCKLKRKGPESKIRFTAFSRPKNAAWEVAVFITNFDWHGFGAEYPLLYGDGHTTAYVFGPGGPYSNEFPVPATPPDTVGGGAIVFSPKGGRISLGLAPAPNADYTGSVIFAGAMKCKYPPRR